MKKSMSPAMVILSLALVIVIGELTFLSPCVHEDGSFGLSVVAATVVNLLGYEAPSMWDESMIEVR